MGQTALVVIQREDGQILLLKKSAATDHPGSWTFPGGTLHDDESPSEAALRELEEETGLNGEIVRAGPSYTSEEHRIYPFLIRAHGELERSHEHSDHAWIDPGDLDQYDTLGSGESISVLGITKEG
jgi:8-oxo-dGTP diphosphatase